MFTSESLRAIRPGQVGLAVREQRLDQVVHLVEVKGVVSVVSAGEISRRLETALAEGVRWAIVDLTGATEVADPLLVALCATARDLRARRGELIVAGGPPDVAERFGCYESATRPALAATVQQALMILKMLRPKTAIHPVERSTPKRITSLTLPRIEPQH